MSVIEIDSLSFRYRSASEHALHDINLKINDGELIFIMGPNEAGKSTLCFTLNGLIPHHSKGEFEGAIKVTGIETRESAVKDLFPHVGLVFQDFEAQLFSTEVELEIAFAPENLGLTQNEIRERIDRSIRTAGIEALRGRQPATLSGGQKQLLAVASVLSLESPILCFDEPTTDLDPKNKRRILTLTRELFERGKQTLVVVEHETEEALLADRIILIFEGRIIADGPAADILRDTKRLEKCCVMPLQLTDLFERLGCEELPLNVEEAKSIWKGKSFNLISNAGRKLEEADSERADSYGSTVIEVENVSFSYGDGNVLNEVSLQIREGEFVAILGQNGSGKTTLAKHFNGLLKPADGEVRVDGKSTIDMSATELGRQIGYVFQNPDHQIFEEQILDEVLFGPKKLDVEPEQAEKHARDALETVGLWERRAEDPFTLTKGLRQKVAVASVLATRPRAIVLDEPTTGLDYGELKQMMALIKRLNEEGHTIIIITHCIWVAAQFAHRTILMSDGGIVADGPTRQIFSREDVLAEANIIAPQIVRFSNELGPTVLSVDEFLPLVERTINLDEDPENADWLKHGRDEEKGRQE